MKPTKYGASIFMKVIWEKFKYVKFFILEIENFMRYALS